MTVLLESIDRFIINVLAQTIVSLHVLHNSSSMLFCRFQVLNFLFGSHPGHRVYANGSAGHPGHLIVTQLQRWQHSSHCMSQKLIANGSDINNG